MAAQPPKQANNVNVNFRMILTECISAEMNISKNHNNNNKNMIAIPNLDYSTFVSLNSNEFCKLLKEECNIAHGKGVKIHGAIKEMLHANNSKNDEIRLDSSLRDQLNWLHIDDAVYTEIINQCWNEMITDDDIKPYKDDRDFQSKINVMLFTMISDQRVTKTIHKLLNTNSMSLHLSDILYDKSIKAIQNKDYSKALLFLDQSIAFKSNPTTPDLYKIFIKKSDCYLALKHYENVIDLATKCINIQPQSIKAHLNAGNAYMELQQFEKAKAMFDKAYLLAQNNPNSTENIKLLQDELPISQLHMHATDNIVRVNYNYGDAAACGDILKQWMSNILDDKNGVIMEYEAAQSDCQSYPACPCLNRITNVLKIYKIWSAKYPHHWQESMLSVMKQMKYSNAILNDFFHIKLVHIDDDKIWQYICKNVGCCNDTKSKCVMYSRNDRNRGECGAVGRRKNLYYGMHQSEEIAMIQTLDVIHSYLMHHDEHNTHNGENDIDIEIDETDIDEKDGRQNRMKDKFVTNVGDDNEFKSLNFGVFFVYSSDSETETETDKKKNDNVRLVKAKYNCLKEELLNNNIYAISHYEWMDVHIRANKLIATLYSKQKWVAHNNGLLNICNGIAPDTPIQMGQLIALFITINFENLSKLFVANGCRLQSENNLHNLKKRHSEIARWSLKLRQAVWYFGTFCSAEEHFYHGFNKKILFNNYHLTIELPLFVTRSLDLLSSHMDTNDNGIIFKLSGCGNTGSSFGYPYFATCMLTDFNYTNDSEAIFFHCNLALNDILQCHQSFDIYLKSLYLFEKITGGYYYFNGLMQYEMNIIAMMKAYLFKTESNNTFKNSKNSKISKIPPYIQQLFEYFCQDIQCTDIWFVPSELNKLSKELKELLFNVWQNRNEIKMQFVQEFQWNIVGDILFKFHSLSEHSAMTGPIFCCKISKIEDGKEQESESKEQQQQRADAMSIDQCAIFIPYCRKSTMRKNDCGEFGLILQKLPLGVTSILFEYEVYCPEAAYSLRVPPQKWMTNGENVAFTSFKTSKINNMSPFTYNVALKIKQIK